MAGRSKTLWRDTSVSLTARRQGALQLWLKEVTCCPQLWSDGHLGNFLGLDDASAPPSVLAACADGSASMNGDHHRLTQCPDPPDFYARGTH